MRKWSLLLALPVLLTLSVGRASAWNGHGHMVVAKIAYDQLGDGEKLKVAEILKQHPHAELFLNKNKPKGVGAGEWAYLKAATWPDWVRGRKQPPEIAKFNHPPYHFIDKPFINPGERDKFSEKDLRPKGDTIVTALPEQLKALSEEKDAAKRAVALCWVLHLIGDVHQPLHCASFYSSKFPKGDRGGNSQLVRANGRALPLHVYWDGLLGSSSRYAVIEADAQEIARSPEFKRERLADQLARAELGQWADDSFNKARVVAYLDGELKSQPLPQPRDESGFEVPHLPENYAPRAQACARMQAALAGHRLADKLKAALK